MKHIMLLASLLLVMNVASGQEEPITTSSPSKIEMIVPGVIQPGQPEVQSGEIWWGLCKNKDDTYEMVQTTVTVFTENDDCGGGVLTIVKTDTDRYFHFLVRGSSLFKEGLVKTNYKGEAKKLLPGEEFGIRSSAKVTITFFALGNVVRQGWAENYSINIVNTIYGAGGVNHKGTVQKIFEVKEFCPYYSETTPVISWVGDIDRDGKPDILLDKHLEPTSHLILFLSSEALDGEIVHKVAEFQMWDC